MEHIVDQCLEKRMPNPTVRQAIELGEIGQAARAIVDLLTKADMTIETAAWVLDLCKESLQFTQLHPPTGT